MATHKQHSALASVCRFLAAKAGQGYSGIVVLTIRDGSIVSLRPNASEAFGESPDDTDTAAPDERHGR